MPSDPMTDPTRLREAHRAHIVEGCAWCVSLSAIPPEAQGEAIEDIPPDVEAAWQPKEETE